MDFKNISAKYRPIPFWSWNEKLNNEETVRQIYLMHDAGLGGFIMHARGGLQTEYMGEEWFSNVESSIIEAGKTGTEAWAYDENGWPSGFGGGIVNGKGEKFQQKFLRMEKGEKQTPHTICNIDGNHFYYEINPFYVDTLDGDVTKDFIKEIYEPYYERYKNGIKGFFTDEPQISRDGIPWSLILPEEYKKAYGEDLIANVDELFFEKGNYKQTRIKFWKLVTELFSKNFMKQIYDWCVERNLEFTGHMVCEGTLLDQLTSNGAVMPHYEYLTIPGMDWLGRNVRNELHCRQVGSAAQQLGRKQVLSESFGLAGHNTGFEEFRKICEWQMVKGINRFCQHLEGYSLRGLRKRDYPPAMNYQQPWWKEYKSFNDAISRIGMILSQGKPVCNTLIIHPQTTAWSMYNNDKNNGLEELNKLFIDTINLMERKHILFHLGDEILIERHGKVEGKTFVIGEARYENVVILPDTILFENTEKLIDEFKSNGGKVVTVDEIVTDDVIDNENVTYAKYEYSDFSLYYFVNSTNEPQNSFIKTGSKVIDITTGDVNEFGGNYSFAPYDSLLVIDDGTQRKEQTENKTVDSINASGEWLVKEQSLNVLTLDYCKYSFDGEVIEENGYVLNILEKACSLKRSVHIKQEFSVESEFVPQELYLVIEKPENFKISVNGEEVTNKDTGYFVDSSFRKIAIDKYFKEGKNEIILETTFKQSEEFYKNLEKSYLFESEKNKLSYDMEIEAVYLAGSFGLKTDGSFEKLDKDAVRYQGKFTIIKPAEKVVLNNLEQQGYPFFAGKLVVEKTINIDNTNKKIVFNKKGVNVICVDVNGENAGKILWNPTELDLSKQLKIGENIIRLTIINNLRNMLGPHHLEAGEILAVGPSAFHKIESVWAKEPPEWNDGYCFVEFGLY